MTPYEKRTYPPRKCCDSRVYEYHRVGCPEVPMCACGHTVASHSPEGCFACAGPPCSGPTFTPVDTDTGNLLDLIADDERKADDYATFLRACETDAECYGYVSVNRVRKRLSNEYGLTIHPRTYSAFWSKACRKGGPMVTSTEWEVSDDRHGKNMGKPVRKRLWVGA